MKRNLSHNRKGWPPTRILTIGFLLLILLGGILLSLPLSAADPQNPVSFFDALFTSTSAVCVTGLTVVNTGLAFSLFGKIVLILLIQIGGLGFMTVAAILFILIGKHISLRERLLLQESFGSDSLQGLNRLVLHAIAVTFSIEIVGAAILMVRLIPEYGTGPGIFYSIFLAISAFCNAGFDPFGFDCSIVNYQTDPTINLVLMTLIILGGIGFAVVVEVCRPSKKGLSLHTRVVLMMTALLLVLGTGLILLTEWKNPATLGGDNLSIGDKILMAFFQSVTLRTAGFDSVGQGSLTSAGMLVSMILMFIGASPASTGGGIKTTTFFAALVGLKSVILQQEDYNTGERRLPAQLIRKAYAILLMALCVILTNTCLICIIESFAGAAPALPDVLYEMISACATVGLSTGITATLTPVSQFLLMLTMFMGRVGLLTVTVTLSGNPSKTNAVRYPEERIMVG